MKERDRSTVTLFKGPKALGVKSNLSWCSKCGSGDKVKKYQGKLLCKACRRAVKKLQERI